MDIVLFTGFTTELELESLEAEAKKYDGLYVDMDEKEQRKYVNDKAKEINDILKELDRSRIDKTAEYRVNIEKEAKAIRVRLENANKPFTLLIDEYKKERAKVLAAEKARLAKIDLLARIEVDHEYGLLMNKNYAAEKAIADEKERVNAEALEKAITERAIEQERINQANIKQAGINAENARLANVEHVRTVNRAIYSSFINSGLDADNAKLATQALIDGKVKNIKINY